jgi:hypothetical protein
MFINGLLVALLLAVILTLFFAIGFRGQRWGPGIAIFFLILFLTTWAGGLWLIPVGPLTWGVHGVSFLVVALATGLLLAAVTPDARRYEDIRPSEDAFDCRCETAIALDVYFWLLIAGLLTAIGARYVAAI